MGRFATFLVGGLVGAGIALLTTPRTGEENRALINDTLNDARRYAHLLSEHHIRHVILLSYSNLGIIKYEKYTQSPTLAREQTFSGQDMENYANMLRGLGFDVQIEQ